MASDPQKPATPQRAHNRAIQWCTQTLKPALREGAYRTRRWATFSYEGAAPPRLLRYTLVAIAVLVTSAVFGITTARTTANFGPHDASYRVTINGSITADAGPLGSLVLDSPLPGPLGVHAIIGEIPDTLTAVDNTSTLQALGNDLDGYLQFFAAPSETITLVAQLLITNAITRALVMALALAVICVSVAYISGRSRRRELSYRAARNTWGITAVVAIAAVVAGVLLTNASKQEAQEIVGRTSYVFDGTALEGARITGRLSGVVDEYGSKLIDVYNKNEAFYASANQALASAYDGWDEQERLKNRTSRLFEKYGVVPAPPEQDLVTMLLISDLHCNVGMAPLIKTAAEKFGATIVLNGGDTTTNGTAIERFCVESFARAVPAGAVMVQADGNHDSALTSAQARSAGVIVLDGEIVDVQGVRFLGDNDPRESRIGQATAQSGTESYADAGQRLANVSCEASTAPDVLLIHTPAVGTATLENGCVPYQFSGHMHTRSGPTYVGRGVQFTSASTAGAVDGKVTIGPLNGISEMTVLRFDRITRKFVDLQVISVAPTGTVQIDQRAPYPDPVAEAQELELANLIPPTGEESDPADDESSPAGEESVPADKESTPDDDESSEDASTEPPASDNAKEDT